MIATIGRVVRGEGIASAMRRAAERIDEALHPLASRARDAAIVNVAAGGLGARTGGIAVQLAARLREERMLRPIDVRTTLPDDAHAVHVEGTSGVRIDDLRRLIGRGVKVVISLHDLTLRERDILGAATGVIVASRFLREHYGVPNAHVIEPSSGAVAPRVLTGGSGIAFAGGVKPHKGGSLLPDIAAQLARRGLTLHVFGGGDVDLLRSLRRHRNVIVHGYYRARTLPSLLARHRIGLVLLPSVVAEGFSMTLSDAWLAGAFAAAFDLGAQAERIRESGGGWLAPLDSGAAGIVELVDRWRAEPPHFVAPSLPTAAAAARAHVALYREWGLLTRSS